MAKVGKSDRVMEETLTVQATLDRKFYRKLKVNMYKCVAHCHENNATTEKELEKCIETCSVPLIKTMEIVDSETDDIQMRFLNCEEKCDKSELNGKNNYDDCISKCSKEFRNAIEDAIKKITIKVEENKF
ncbi:hypothetical protein HCN44_006947 [Aphidius gifuensis]|uniref:Uncharacterized protein n=1 Tax=Aphidius gifuensis TaxID=684658 RepID=A0A835CWU4_APHGI|nr:protein FAM136A-like [Aphidius gifuensis]KAF7995840.1 hypothetical protein HCN44_006947 [Aphidius gifuensis]